MSTEVIGFRVEETLKRRLEDAAARSHRPLADLYRDLVFAGMVAEAHAEQSAVDGRPQGQQYPKDNAVRRVRRVLPEHVADALHNAHQEIGASYRDVAAALNLDVAMWWRLTRGQRCPSPEVAEQIIERLGLDAETAQDLREAASQTSAALRPSRFSRE